MKLSDFDFHLPEELIALRPASPRDSARLLVVRGPEGRLEDRSVNDLPELLKSGDILVANDTRVIRAALLGVRPARSTEAPGQGADVEIEVNLNTRLSAADHAACVARTRWPDLISRNTLFAQCPRLSTTPVCDEATARKAGARLFNRTRIRPFTVAPRKP